LRSKYQGSTKVKQAQLQALRRGFDVLCMKENESVNDFFAIANCMTAHGERMEQVVIFDKVLRSMTPKFNYVVCSIEESNDATALSIDELHSFSLVQEQRMKSQSEKDEEQALKISSYGRGNRAHVERMW
jgi:hypothetical protein